MIEEFAAILGCSLDSATPIALPSLGTRFLDNLITFFDMPPDDIYLCLFPSRTMNLSSLITACETKNKDNPAWIITISFCLYAQFLLVSSQGEADTRIISILEQVANGANPIPVILAETIISLDNFKTEHHLSGSLLLLQVCNQNLYLFFI